MYNKKQIRNNLRCLGALGDFRTLAWIWHAYSHCAFGRQLHSAVASVKLICSYPDLRKRLWALAKEAMQRSHAEGR